VRYGLSVEITAFSMVTPYKVVRNGETFATAEVTVMASAVVHDIGPMRATFAVPLITATGTETHLVQSDAEFRAFIEISDLFVGKAQADLAKKLAAELLKAYYDFPAYIVQVKDNVVTIDLGQSWCKKGDVLTVFGPPTEEEIPQRGNTQHTRKITIPGDEAGTLTITHVFGDISRGTFKGNGKPVLGGYVAKGAGAGNRIGGGVGRQGQEEVDPTLGAAGETPATTAGGEAGELIVAFSKTSATPAVLAEAEKKGVLGNLNMILDGLEGAVRPHIKPPLMLTGGRTGWEMYKALTMPGPVDDLLKNVKYGMSMEVLGYTEEVHTRPMGSRTVATLKIETTVAVTIMKVGTQKPIYSDTVFVSTNVTRAVSVSDGGDTTATSKGGTYTVLALDVSGSMGGVPLEKTKQAAMKFCDMLAQAKGENHLALVVFNARASLLQGFTKDVGLIKQKISQISASGNTNTGQAMEIAGQELEKITDATAVKNIVLMTDGVPTTGPDALKKAEELKPKCSIYAMGFYHELYKNPAEMAMAQKLLQNMQNAGYYEVDDPNDLAFTFTVVADTIISNLRSGEGENDIRRAANSLLQGLMREIAKKATAKLNGEEDTPQPPKLPVLGVGYAGGEALSKKITQQGRKLEWAQTLETIARTLEADISDTRKFVVRADVASLEKLMDDPMAKPEINFSGLDYYLLATIGDFDYGVGGIKQVVNGTVAGVTVGIGGQVKIMDAHTGVALPGGIKDVTASFTSEPLLMKRGGEMDGSGWLPMVARDFSQKAIQQLMDSVFPTVVCAAGHKNPAGTKFCSTCGVSLANPVCPKGHKNPAGARFCTECGEPLR